MLQSLYLFVDNFDLAAHQSVNLCVVFFSFLFCSICLLITALFLRVYFIVFIEFLLKLGLRGFRCQSNICLRFQSALDNNYFSSRLNFLINKYPY